MIKQFQYNELTYETNKKKEELKNLTELWMKLESEYDTKDVEISTINQKEKLTHTEEMAIRETFDSSCLAHKLQTYKEDLSGLKLKIRRWNRKMDKFKRREHELNIEEDLLNKKFADILQTIEENEKKKNNENKESLFDNIEANLKKYENKLAVEKIEENQKFMDKQKESIKTLLKKNEELKINRKHKHKWHEQRVNHFKMVSKIENEEIKLNNLLYIMKLSKYDEISPRYNNLIEDEICLDIVTEQHKRDIEEVKMEIEGLRDEFLQNTEIRKRNTPLLFFEDSTDFEEERQEGVDIDVNGIISKEIEIKEMRFKMAIEEQNYNSVWDTYQKSCNVVSRIMYQLEPINVKKNLSVINLI